MKLRDNTVIEELLIPESDTRIEASLSSDD